MVPRSSPPGLASRAEDTARGVEEPWRAVEWDRPLQGAVEGRHKQRQDPEQQAQRD